MSETPIADVDWSALASRNGGSTWVPAWLTALLENPSDDGRFSDKWPELTSEGTTWPAGIGAFPFLVDLAGKRSPGARGEHLAVLGFIAQDWEASTVPSIAAEVEVAYRSAIARALQLTTHDLALPVSDERQLRSLLSTVAALHGSRELAVCLDELDDEDTCPPYAEHLDGA